MEDLCSSLAYASKNGKKQQLLSISSVISQNFKLRSSPPPISGRSTIELGKGWRITAILINGREGCL